MKRLAVGLAVLVALAVSAEAGPPQPVSLVQRGVKSYHVNPYVGGSEGGRRPVSLVQRGVKSYHVNPYVSGSRLSSAERGARGTTATPRPFHLTHGVRGN
jgi:hypothetical protein